MWQMMSRVCQEYVSFSFRNINLAQCNPYAVLFIRFLNCLLNEFVI